MEITRKGIYTTLWIIWLLTLISSLVFASLSLVVLSGLFEWTSEAQLTTIDSISDRLSGVIGSTGILLIALSFYFLLSIVVLLGRICSSPEALDFRYGVFAGFTCCMVFITLQTALVVNASIYLTEATVNFEPQIPLFPASDTDIFRTTAIMGYVTTSLFLILFLFIMSHQFSVCCGCCPDIEDRPKRMRARVKEPEAPAPAAPQAPKPAPKPARSSKP
mmetsp:Transcript_29259/g.69802  ORF Transcript_29259/g.69802 Transcript_29259/m.69802 type:complete len:219 (+) Transcript_29259:158-814(+)